MIDKLEMFIALANERHFGRAAARHGVTQPSLSAAIRQLEGELGVQLVMRGARFQGLTPEGERVLVWARRIVTDARQMRDEMRARRKGLSGQVRLGVIPTALPMVATLITPFLQRHPNLRVQILSRTSVEILAEMESLQLDAGISYLDNEPLGRVTTVALYRERYRLLIRADDPLARAAIASQATVGVQSGSDAPAGAGFVRWRDLGAAKLCLLVGTMQNRRIIDRYLAQAGVSVQAAVESNSLLALVSQVLSGGWATVVTEQAARMFANRPDLVALPIASDTFAGDPFPGSTDERPSDTRPAGPEVGLIAPWRETHTPVLAALIDAAERLGRKGQAE